MSFRKKQVDHVGKCNISVRYLCELITLESMMLTIQPINSTYQFCASFVQNFMSHRRMALVGSTKSESLSLPLRSNK